MKELKLIDKIVNEPIGGAHSDKESTYKIVSKTILETFEELNKLSPEELVSKRIDKYVNMGEFKER